MRQTALRNTRLTAYCLRRLKPASLDPIRLRILHEMSLRRHAFKTCVGTLVAVITAFGITSALAQQAPQTPSLESAHWWGVNAHLMWYGLDAAIADLDKVHAAGLNRVRFDLNWAVFEPNQKGVYDEAYLTKLDGVIGAARARGI